MFTMALLVAFMLAICIGFGSAAAADEVDLDLISSEVPDSPFLEHVKNVIEQCGGQADVLRKVAGCEEGLNTTLGAKRDATSTTEVAASQAVFDFVSCLEPYKQVLQACPDATVRNDGLATLEMGLVLVRNKGRRLFPELDDLINRELPIPCTPDKLNPINEAFTACFQELGTDGVEVGGILVASVRDFPLPENFCNLTTALSVCMRSLVSDAVFAQSPCLSLQKELDDIIRTAFEKAVARSRIPDVLFRCFGLIEPISISSYKPAEPELSSSSGSNSKAETSNNAVYETPAEIQNLTLSGRNTVRLTAMAVFEFPLSALQNSQ